MSKCPEGQICFGRELFVIVTLFIISLIIFGVAKNPLDLQINDSENFTEQNIIKKSKKTLMNPNQYYYLNDKSNTDNFNNNNITNSNISMNQGFNQNKDNLYLPSSLNHKSTREIDPFPIKNTINIPITNNNPTYQNDNQQVPINIPTRGYNTNYKQIGILHSKNKKNFNNQKILPLFGRQKYPGSTKWQYYTNTDGFNTLPIPIVFKGKRCMDEFGCEEISDGDTIRVPAYGQAFRVTLYGNEAPTYIPYIN